MKKPSSAALAVGVGYVLGRRHKLRWALLFAAAATTGNLTGRLMKQGGKLLGSSDALAKVSPELGKLAGTVKGDLADAGKAAAKAAVTSRVDALAGSLHDKAEAVRAQKGEASGEPEAQEASDEQDESDREAGPDEESGPDETAPDRRSSARPGRSPGRDRPGHAGSAPAARPPRPRSGERESQASRTGRGQK